MIRFIEVTKKHIENGIRGDECNCAIALALQDEYKTSDVSVEVEDEPMLFIGDKILELATSEMAEDVNLFIQDFDYNNEVKPFTIKVYERAGV
jgi:predicted secreted protein|tara:strand:- start:43 stop:321 length:279 start_codon:yes stop_codon:yes gene_type:complete